LNDVIQIDRPTDEVSQRALAVFAAKAMRTIGMKGELSVRITSNREIQKLNRRFRRKDKPTDVLSFPAALNGTVGDIAISRDIAAASANRLGHPLATELKVLILHGLLHLAGYDHESDNGEMTAQESQLRLKLGLPVGLIERTNGSPARPQEQIPRSARDDKSKKLGSNDSGAPSLRLCSGQALSARSGGRVGSKRGGHRA
jgi:probable rRNA maturation factor